MPIDVTIELKRGMPPVNGSLVLFKEATRSWKEISPSDEKLPTAYVELCQNPSKEVIRNIRIDVSDFEDADPCAVVLVEVADDGNKNHELIQVTLGPREGTVLKKWHFVETMLVIHCVLAKDEEEEVEEGCKTPEPPRKKRKRKRKGH